ncbi:Tyrosine-protein kinase [Trichinella spiralis]|uniref:Tyrosine-protein kinase n=1 Tax=Trichinella spiralis TaxID=6334 RepID=A0ABR3L146_TRISP
MNDDQNEQADLGLPNFIRPSQTPTGKQFNSNRPSSVCCPPVRMESSPVMAAARRRQPTPAVAEGQPPTSPFPFHNIQADKTLVHVVNRTAKQLCFSHS